MPVVMPTVTGTRANVARLQGYAPERSPAPHDGCGKTWRSLKNP